MSEGAPEIRYSFGGSLTPVVRVLLFSNLFVYLFINVAVHPQELVQILGLIPHSVIADRAYWQPFTYLFVHVTLSHFLLNMFALWWTGSEVERYFGSRRFWHYYLFTGVGGGLAAIATSWNSEIPVIGASGAIFGLLVAYGFLFPDRTIYLWFVVPIRAKYAVMAFGALTLYFLWQGTSDGVSHIAHLGGLIAGLVWFFFMRGKGWFARVFRSLQKRRMRRKLRLISRKKNDDDNNPMTGYSNKTVH